MSAAESQAAIAELEKRIAREPSNAELAVEYAQALTAAGRIAEAGEALIKAGDLLAQNGDPDSAIEVYRQAADLPQADGATLTRLGSLLLRTGKPDQARVEFERALAAGSDGQAKSGLAEAYVTLAEGSLRNAQYDDALDFLESAAENGADDARVEIAREQALAGQRDRREADELFGRGSTLLDDDEFAAALVSLRRALELEQSAGLGAGERSLAVRLLAANAAASLDDPDAALAMCDEIIRAAPSSSPRSGATVSHDVWARYAAAASLVAAWARYLVNETDEAVEVLARAREHPAFAIRARWLETTLLWSQGHYQKAWARVAGVEERRLIQAAAYPGPSLDLEELRAYGSALQTLGELDTAQRVFEEGTRADERHTGFWMDLGNVLLERAECEPSATGFYMRSRRAYQRAARLLNEALSARAHAGHEALALAHLRLGHAHVALEQYGPARDHLTRARDLTAVPSVKALAESNIGMACARQGDFKRAEKFFSAALRERPDNAVLRVHVADANLKLGKPTVAEDHYRAILRWAPNNIDARIGLGESLVALAENDEPDLYEAAVEEYSKALRLHATMRGDVYGWCASISLTPRRAAGVYYARGFARVQLYESRGSGPLSRRGEGRLLKLAERDFRRALNEDRGHGRASRAAEKVRAARQQAVPRRFTEQVAPLVVVIVSMVLLAFVQTNYFFGGLGPRLSAPSWQIATLGLLAFIVAGFSLPYLLKLRVAGIEVQRAAVEQTGIAPSLSIAADVVAKSVIPDFSPAFGSVPRAGAAIDAASEGASKPTGLANDGIRRGAQPPA